MRSFELALNSRISAMVSMLSFVLTIIFGEKIRLISILFCNFSFNSIFLFKITF